MSRPFYNENAPMPFRGLDERERLVAPSRELMPPMFAPGGMLGPMGYWGGPMYPFLTGPVGEFYPEEKDPNP